MIKADITRDSLVRSAHRRTVRHQQGRVPIDADINEAQDLIVERVETEARDVIGRSGGPKARRFPAMAGAPAHMLCRPALLEPGP